MKDNGIGMNPDLTDRVFQVFQSLHVQGTYEGTGIGLAIARKAVENQGGEIWVETAPDEGSTFYFTIPDDQTEGPTNGRPLTSN